ncbi:MAG: DNA-binding response regulator [Rhodospirillaceae bacterium]|nr:DNA-binding response regulator [Rhodospirillaceae bacterium]|tara:strand:- start:246 stop:926 length:681 start_codon:yes stop_codon:yes gene_type:complete
MDADVSHILVVDDDQRLRELLRRYLTENGFFVDVAGDAADARVKLRSLDYDLLILDVMMPGEDGFSFTASLKEERDVPILLLTAMNEPADRVTGLERGADDYLSKPFEPRELLLRIANILRRGRRFAAQSKAVVTFGDFAFDLSRGELRRQGVFVRLTQGEAALLKVFVENLGTPISREELGARSDVGDRSVDVQVTRLRRKIENDPRNPRHLRTVRGAGYVLQPG